MEDRFGDILGISEGGESMAMNGLEEFCKVMSSLFSAGAYVEFQFLQFWARTKTKACYRLLWTSWEPLMVLLKSGSCYYLLYVSIFLVRIVFIT